MSIFEGLVSGLAGASRGYMGAQSILEARKRAQAEAAFRAQQLGLQTEQLGEEAKYHQALIDARNREMGLAQEEIVPEGFDIPGLPHLPGRSDVLKSVIPYLSQRYETGQRIAHPEAFITGRGEEEQNLGPKDIAQLRLGLIKDVYGTPQLGVSPEQQDEAYNLAYKRAQMLMPEVFGQYQEPPDPVNTFLQGYSSQEEVNEGLKVLARTDPTTYAAIRERVAMITRAWPKKRKEIGAIKNIPSAPVKNTKSTPKE